MRFSRSTHLLMFLSLETLRSIIRTGLPILVELIGLSYILVEVLNKCLKVSCFSDCWKVSYMIYTLMIFLMMLSVILLSMLMILLSIHSVIRHLICGNNWKWLLNLNLICKTLWTGVRSCLLISVLSKLSRFCLTGLITMVLLM